MHSRPAQRLGASLAPGSWPCFELYRLAPNTASVPSVLPIQLRPFDCVLETLTKACIPKWCGRSSVVWPSYVLSKANAQALCRNIPVHRYKIVALDAFATTNPCRLAHCEVTLLPLRGPKSPVVVHVVSLDAPSSLPLHTTHLCTNPRTRLPVSPQPAHLSSRASRSALWHLDGRIPYLRIRPLT